MGIFSFLFGRPDTSSPYQKKDDNWVYKGNVLDRQPVSRVKTLNNVFAKDEIGAFYKNTAITDSDSASFAALNEHYAKDGQHVYYCDTYRKGQEYFSVKHNLVTILGEADAASFSLLKWGYAKDARQVFFEGKLFAGVDAATFQVLESGFSKDNKKVYFHRVEIAGADAKSFRVLNDHYSKDSRQVFYSSIDYNAPGGSAPVSRVLENADSGTFAVTDGSDGRVDAKDKSGFYKRGLKLK
ncbi:DKNYY domain-containing protein [Dyadobacter luticola]|nr:DKNYY domain-containing protein [Dyadobacter luticola]